LRVPGRGGAKATLRLSLRCVPSASRRRGGVTKSSGVRWRRHRCSGAEGNAGQDPRQDGREGRHQREGAGRPDVWPQRDGDEATGRAGGSEAPIVSRWLRGGQPGSTGATRKPIMGPTTAPGRHTTGRRARALRTPGRRSHPIDLLLDVSVISGGRSGEDWRVLTGRGNAWQGRSRTSRMPRARKSSLSKWCLQVAR
jgi:hypothetical protein